MGWGRLQALAAMSANKFFFVRGSPNVLSRMIFPPCFNVSIVKIKWINQNNIFQNCIYINVTFIKYISSPTLMHLTSLEIPPPPPEYANLMHLDPFFGLPAYSCRILLASQTSCPARPSASRGASSPRYQTYRPYPFHPKHKNNAYGIL